MVPNDRSTHCRFHVQHASQVTLQSVSLAISNQLSVLATSLTGLFVCVLMSVFHVQVTQHNYSGKRVLVELIILR